MKLVRILIYEGEEDDIRHHMKRAFVHPDRPHASPEIKVDVTIHEIFRGLMTPDVVALAEHLNVTEPEIVDPGDGLVPT